MHSSRSLSCSIRNQTEFGMTAAVHERKVHIQHRKSVDKTRVNIEMNRNNKKINRKLFVLWSSLFHLNVFCFSYSLTFYLILNLFHMSSCYFGFCSQYIFFCISKTSTFNGSVFLLSSWTFFSFVCVSIISPYSHCKTDSFFHIIEIKSWVLFSLIRLTICLGFFFSYFPFVCVSFHLFSCLLQYHFSLIPLVFFSFHCRDV